MKISDLLAKGGLTVSCELFPPKQFEKMDEVKEVVAQTAALSPAFISCTYGATGGTSDYTVDIARAINSHGIPALAHLTCVSSTREKVASVINELKNSNIENVLALRGDIPPQGRIAFDYAHASDLIEDLNSQGDFCIGCACYPEGHPESANADQDIEYMAQKYQKGASFFTSQLFFDNSAFLSFCERVRSRGIKAPVIAGIMPVTNAVSIERMIKLSNCRVTPSLAALLQKYGGTPDMERAGLDFSIGQINDLISKGVRHIHIYTMNKPSVAKTIMDGIER
ncbi:MAG: methylenetetrahydrofolate reductase [Clostridia bacterium]|nr:methylenetetrahydrofolate reductase [Clostridia bacterium]